MAAPRPIVIIGVGNDYRSDDGAGLTVSRKLNELGIPGIEVIEGISDGTVMINSWQGARAVFIIDSVVSGGDPGTVYRFNGLEDELREDMFPGYSTHAFSVPETIRLAKILGQVPRSLTVYGIEACNFKSGNGLTAEVASGVEDVVRRIQKELSDL